MTLPTRYTLDRVPWGDCACCDSGRCAAHVEHPDRDPPSRPTTAALVEKIERLYVRSLEERVRGLHESCTGLVKQNERQYDEVLRLTAERDTVGEVLAATSIKCGYAFKRGVEAMREAAVNAVEYEHERDILRLLPDPEDTE